MEHRIVHGALPLFRKRVCAQTGQRVASELFGNGSASVEGAHIDTSPGLVHSTQPSCPHRRVSSVDVRTTPSHLLPLFAFAAFAFVSGPAGTPLDH